MTEAEWLKSDTALPMLKFLRTRQGARKRRLFAVAACRRIWPLIPQGYGHQAVETAEALADGLVGEDARWDAYVAAGEGSDEDSFPNHANQFAAYCAYRVVEDPSGFETPVPDDEDAASWVAQQAVAAASWDEARRDYDPAASVVECRAQADLLREIYGNPFRPIELDPSRLPPEIVRTARAIYDRADFGRLPELAGALKGAGGVDPALVEHLRGAGPHVKGCWALDLLLGKGPRGPAGV